MILFIILFSISLLGISVIYIKNKKAEKPIYLIEKICNVNSIKFEALIKKIKFFLNRQQKPVKKIIAKGSKIPDTIIDYSKKNIRKKLFHDKETTQTSEFIQEMKKQKKD